MCIRIFCLFVEWMCAYFDRKYCVYTLDRTHKERFTDCMNWVVVIDTLIHIAIVQHCYRLLIINCSMIIFIDLKIIGQNKWVNMKTNDVTSMLNVWLFSKAEFIPWPDWCQWSVLDLLFSADKMWWFLGFSINNWFLTMSLVIERWD